MTPGAPSSDRYARQFLVGWRMMDFNGHLANTTRRGSVPPSCAPPVAGSTFARGSSSCRHHRSSTPCVVPHAPGFVEMPLP